MGGVGGDVEVCNAYATNPEPESRNPNPPCRQAMVRFGMPPGCKRPENTFWREKIYPNSQPCTAFATDEEGETAELQLEQFMANVLVPLAIETNALVISTCFSCCTMGFAFGRAAALVKAQYHGHLPFQILTFALAHGLAGRMGIEGSFANELSAKIPRWAHDRERVANARRKATHLEQVIDFCFLKSKVGQVIDIVDATHTTASLPALPIRSTSATRPTNPHNTYNIYHSVLRWSSSRAIRSGMSCTI